MANAPFVKNMEVKEVETNNVPKRPEPFMTSLDPLMAGNNCLYPVKNIDLAKSKSGNEYLVVTLSLLKEDASRHDVKLPAVLSGCKQVYLSERWEKWTPTEDDPYMMMAVSFGLKISRRANSDFIEDKNLWICSLKFVPC